MHLYTLSRLNARALALTCRDAIFGTGACDFINEAIDAAIEDGSDAEGSMLFSVNLRETQPTPCEAIHGGIAMSGVDAAMTSWLSDFRYLCK